VRLAPRGDGFFDAVGSGHCVFTLLGCPAWGRGGVWDRVCIGSGCNFGFKPGNALHCCCVCHGLAPVTRLRERSAALKSACAILCMLVVRDAVPAPASERREPLSTQRDGVVKTFCRAVQ
jgi:hypothetical protein